ncbi:hypothetical protein [Pleionea sp. CnH1-48]|uniref:hypothetical protein n=1 Tax=Pleionea sp. CnH1-48 TaxID=2954494 RepID=UPI002097500D|nr:hypothetical protein [Pleionea sp. CnH1-48]MCO7223920.1 hypothetical protein [Pleionea sp. CnH1-48]
MMGYRIYAWLNEGKPCLRIYKDDSDTACVEWDYQLANEQSGDEGKEIQRLFRQLLLLTCEQELNQNVRLFRLSSDSLAPSFTT